MTQWHELHKRDGEWVRTGCRDGLDRLSIARMKATLWHNPRCGTSRKTLAILQATPGVDLTVVDYLTSRFTRTKLEQLIGDAGMSPRTALRARGTDAEERGLAHMDDDAILDAMAADPVYVDRPFVETERGTRFCRPPETEREIL